MLDFIALGMMLEEDLTGYDIKKRIENGIGTFYKASYGSLYPALKKLTEHGRLTTYEQRKEAGKKSFIASRSRGSDLFCLADGADGSL